MTDPTFHSIADIVSFAIRREIDAAEGYARIAALAATPGLRELAEDLKTQEESHRRLLEGLGPDDLRELAPALLPDLRIVDALPDEKIAPDMTLQEMLVFAAKKEAQAVGLYESLIRMAKTSDQVRLFRFLAGQEREHKLRIEAAYERQILQEN
jgi:rubrerythrin